MNATARPSRSARCRYPAAVPRAFTSCTCAEERPALRRRPRSRRPSRRPSSSRPVPSFTGVESTCDLAERRREEHVQVVVRGRARRDRVADDLDGVRAGRGRRDGDGLLGVAVGGLADLVARRVVDREVEVRGGVRDVADGRRRATRRPRARPPWWSAWRPGRWSAAPLFDEPSGPPLSLPSTATKLVRHLPGDRRPGCRPWPRGRSRPPGRRPRPARRRPACTGCRAAATCGATRPRSPRRPAAGPRTNARRACSRCRRGSCCSSKGSPVLSTGTPYGWMAMNRVWLLSFSPPIATSRDLAPSGTVTKYDLVLLRCTVPDAEKVYFSGGETTTVLRICLSMPSVLGSSTSRIALLQTGGLRLGRDLDRDRLVQRQRDLVRADDPERVAGGCSPGAARAGSPCPRRTYG